MPALVFGIPGDSVTAIAIGVLMMKGIDPGPTIFINSPQDIYAIFLIFLLANLLMLPLGWAMIKASSHVLAVPRSLLMPIVLVLSIVGTYATNNTFFDVYIMLAFGLLAFLMEENGLPVAPAILGLILGPLLEDTFVTSMIKSNGDPIGLVNRPFALVLALFTLLIVVWTLANFVRRTWLSGSTAPAATKETLS